MNIHEYQAKALLAKYGVAVPRGGVAYTPDEAVEVARGLGGPVYVVKAQIHAGGRGKAGGVKVVKSTDEVRDIAGKLLGMKLVTHQTGPAGKEVKRVYVEEGCDIKRELYLGILVDRGRHGDRGGRRQASREDPQGGDRSGRRHAGVLRPQDRLRARPDRQPGRQLRQVPQRDVP